VVTAHENGRAVGRAEIVPGRQPSLVVPLRPGPLGTCFVVFDAAETRVPARVQPGSTDTRRLAAHFFAFDYSPR
jgi:hypothetical protein